MTTNQNKYVPLPKLKGVRSGKPVARRVLAWLVAHPDQHDQASWTGPRVFDYDVDHEVTMKDGALNCGTTCCIGGTIALADGWTWDDVANGKEMPDPDGGTMIETVEDHARRRLAVNVSDAYDLFHCMDEGVAITRLARVANGEPAYQGTEDE